MEAMAIDHSRFAFVDLGSGKGRALMLAAAYPFRRIIGVEFARELHEAAQKNVLALPDDSKIELVHGDAADFRLPDGAVALFLYNPFGEELVRRVARNALSSLQENPRDFRLFYLNALHEAAWSEAGFEVAERGQGFTIFGLPVKAGAALDDQAAA
jgi:predicted RNA methylase